MFNAKLKTEDKSSPLSQLTQKVPFIQHVEGSCSSSSGRFARKMRWKNFYGELTSSSSTKGRGSIFVNCFFLLKSSPLTGTILSSQLSISRYRTLIFIAAQQAIRMTSKPIRLTRIKACVRPFLIGQERLIRVVYLAWTIFFPTFRSEAWVVQQI